MEFSNEVGLIDRWDCGAHTRRLAWRANAANGTPKQLAWTCQQSLYPHRDTFLLLRESSSILQTATFNQAQNQARAEEMGIAAIRLRMGQV